MKIYDVAVIMINYNSSEHTIQCIQSIVENTDGALSYGISIVDNASEPRDYNNLLSGLSQFENTVDLHLFRSRINTGFSMGNMLGVQFMSARYYFFLNNDCKLQNDCLNILHQFCEENSDAALCSPQLYSESGKPQPCFDYFPYLITKLFGLGVLRLAYGKRYIKRKGIYTRPVQVDVVSGSQMFTRASAFEAIGGFDTTYFLFCEEEDIALRLSRKGSKAYLVPMAKNIHTGGGSTTPSPDIKREFYISFLYFYLKHFGLLRQLLLRFVLAVRLFRKGFAKPEYFSLAFFVATGAHSRHSLKHRQALQAMQPIQSLTLIKP
jgi:hypothetical protein